MEWRELALPGPERPPVSRHDHVSMITRSDQETSRRSRFLAQLAVAHHVRQDAGLGTSLAMISSAE